MRPLYLGSPCSCPRRRSSPCTWSRVLTTSIGFVFVLHQQTEQLKSVGRVRIEPPCNMQPHRKQTLAPPLPCLCSPFRSTIEQLIRLRLFNVVENLVL